MIEIVAQALITEAAEKLGATHGNWASLVDVRKACKISREDFDRAARQLAIMGTVTMIPNENQKTITEADARDAIMIGEPQHFVTIN